MGDIINISNIHDYNEFLGIETLNPLVTFIDFREVKVLKHKRKYYGFYGIYLKEKIHGKLTYGRSQYDYQEGTLVFVAPGQVAGIDDGGETLNPEGNDRLFSTVSLKYRKNCITLSTSIVAILSPPILKSCSIIASVFMIVSLTHARLLIVMFLLALRH